MGRRALIGSLLVFLHLPGLLCYALPTVIEPEAEGPEYVSFKVYIDRDLIGSVETLCRGETVFIRFDALMKLLGFSCETEVGQNGELNCCLQNEECFTIRSDSVERNGTVTLLPDSLHLYNDEAQLYVRDRAVQQLCGFTMQVVFQSLALLIDQKTPFPITVLRQQQRKREQLFDSGKVIPTEEVDTVAPGISRLTSLGYALSTSFAGDKLIGSSAQLSANGEFMRGSLNLTYSYDQSMRPDKSRFTFRQDYTLQKPLLKQVSAFRSNTAMTTNLKGYANGIYLSNDANTFFEKRNYLYKGQTRPDANIEIYNNNELITYATSDSLGNYQALIPMVPGANQVVALTLDNFGASTPDERTVYLSVNLEQKQQFRYHFTSGYSDAGEFFGGLGAAYGITNFLTVTANAETVLDSSRVRLLAGAGLKWSGGKAVQLSADYYPEVKYRLSVTGSPFRYLAYNASFEHHNAQQTVIRGAPRRSLQLDISSQLFERHLPTLLTFSLRQLNYQHSTNFSTYLRMTNYYRRLSLSSYVNNSSQQNFRLGTYLIGSQLGYRITERLYNEASYEWSEAQQEHRFRNRTQYQLAQKLFVNFDAQYTLQRQQVNLQLSLVYRFPWMSAIGSAQTTGRKVSGSMGFNGGLNFYSNGAMSLTNRSAGGASLHVALYIDDNGNKQFDKGETIVRNPQIFVKTGAQMTQRKSGTYFSNLMPNSAFRLIIPRQSFGDISWQIDPVEKILYLSAYQSRSLYFPIKVISEVSGEVYQQKKGKRVALRSVPVEIVCSADSAVMARVLTDEWGSYNFLGLTTGIYQVRTASRRYKSKDEKVHILTVPATKIGEHLDGIDFEMEKK